MASVREIRMALYFREGEFDLLGICFDAHAALLQGRTVKIFPVVGPAMITGDPAEKLPWRSEVTGQRFANVRSLFGLPVPA